MVFKRNYFDFCNNFLNGNLNIKLGVKIVYTRAFIKLDATLDKHAADFIFLADILEEYV